jgi:uncharacterized protein (DUF2141 family)
MNLKTLRQFQGLYLKKGFLLFWLINSPCSLSIANTGPDSEPLRVRIENLKSGQGGVNLTIFDKNHQKDFPIKPETAVFQKYQPLNGQNELDFLVTHLPDGEYSAFAYHDENGDHKINTNMIGIPKEGYGASQGAKNKFGPPSFNDAKFILSAKKPNGKPIPIRIEY